MTPPVSHILMVEDNDGDVLLARAAFRRAGVMEELIAVADGVEALDYLRRQGRYADAPRPDLILLDLNLPRKDGRELLAEVKADPALRAIPILILTSSSADSDIRQAYDLHANAYLVKPAHFDKLVEMVKSIHDFWSGQVTWPAP